MNIELKGLEAALFTLFALVGAWKIFGWIIKTIVAYIVLYWVRSKRE